MGDLQVLRSQATIENSQGQFPSYKAEVAGAEADQITILTTTKPQNRTPSSVFLKTCLCDMRMWLRRPWLLPKSYRPHRGQPSLQRKTLQNGLGCWILFLLDAVYPLNMRVSNSAFKVPDELTIRSNCIQRLWRASISSIVRCRSPGVRPTACKLGLGVV